MPIETDMPMEIEDYKEKLIGNMSLRQLGCFSVAAILSVATYFLCTGTLGLSMNATSYVIIGEALPLMALGFVRKDGQPFEKYFALVIRQKLGVSKLAFRTETEGEGPEERKSGNDWIFRKRDGKEKGCPAIPRRARRAESRRKEADVFLPGKTDCKRKRKEALAKIGMAQSEFRAAKRGTKRADAGGRRAEEQHRADRVPEDVRRRAVRG